MDIPPSATERNLNVVFQELRKVWEREAEHISLVVDLLNEDYWSLRQRLMKRDPKKRYWGGLYLVVCSIKTKNPHLPSHALYWRKGNKQRNADPKDSWRKKDFPETRHVPIGSSKHDAHYSKNALNRALRGCSRWEKELTHRFEEHAAVLRKTFHRQHEVADKLLAYPPLIEELPCLNTTKTEELLAAWIAKPNTTK